MDKLNECINGSFDKISFIGPWFLRIILGVSFFLFGYGKFPLPAERLIAGFGFSNSVATLIPLVEVIGGIGIIVTGFIGGLWGQLLTRVFALGLSVFMVFAFILAHSNWFITADLFKNIQIFLFGVSLYFVFKPKS